MVEIDTGFSEAAPARRAVEEDRKKAQAYLLAEWNRIWTEENRPVTVVDLNAMAAAIRDGRHAR
jgi:hypothetical protein